MCASQIIALLLMIYFLFPVYFRKRRYLFIITSVLLLTLIVIIVNYFFPQLGPQGLPPPRHSGPPPPPPHIPPREIPIFFRLFNTALPIGVSMTIALFGEFWAMYNQKEKDMLALEIEKTDAELKLLKSQINPHFLFNALNNIYTLSLLKSDRTSESIMKLSEIMRYVLYETGDDKVNLKSEIQYIKDYLSIFQLKSESEFHIQLNININPGEKFIHPMLFMPLVENALKHGNLNTSKDAFLKISLDEYDGHLDFKVLNSYDESETKEKDSASGIGLKNVKKRLELLYPGQHHLEINKENKTFTVTLNIPSS